MAFVFYETLLNGEYGSLTNPEYAGLDNMASIHTTIADAVTSALNAASTAETLSQSFTAVRVYVPELQLRDTEDEVVVRVWPAPEGRVSTFETRGKKRRIYPIYVGVMKKCDVDDNDVVDAYCQLLEEIEDLLLGLPLTGYTSAVCTTAEETALFAWEDMRHNRQYTGVVKFTFMKIG